MEVVNATKCNYEVHFFLSLSLWEKTTRSNTIHHVNITLPRGNDFESLAFHHAIFLGFRRVSSVEAGALTICKSMLKSLTSCWNSYASSWQECIYVENKYLVNLHGRNAKAGTRKDSRSSQLQNTNDHEVFRRCLTQPFGCIERPRAHSRDMG